MQELKLPGALAQWTDAAEGHLASSCPGAPQKWLLLRQVHGGRVVVADSKTQPEIEADAAVTTFRGVTLGIKTADCAPIALTSPEIVGAVHAGWPGIISSVIPNAVAKMRSLGASRISAALGPCIHPCCYEFGTEDLMRVIDATDDSVRATTRTGTDGLDLPRAVRVQLDRLDVDLVYEATECTSCSGRYFSHRRTGEKNRQVMFVSRA